MAELTLDDMREAWHNYTAHRDEYCAWGLINLTAWMGERTGFLLRCIDELSARDAELKKALASMIETFAHYTHRPVPPMQPGCRGDDEWLAIERARGTLQAGEGDAGNPLPCGCIRGHYLCPEAVRLWTLVNNAYEVLRRDFDNTVVYDEYKDRLDEYYQHFEAGAFAV